jgi:hypothetical protein
MLHIRMFILVEVSFIDCDLRRCWHMSVFQERVHQSDVLTVLINPFVDGCFLNGCAVERDSKIFELFNPLQFLATCINV